MKEGNNNRGSFYFLVNNLQVAYGDEYVPDYKYQQASATINLYLTAGQIVQVENYISTTIYGTDSNWGYRSWFTGFLLYAL